MSRRIPYFAFGTYYTKYAATPGPNAHEVQCIHYWAKDKWGSSSVLVQHPLHPTAVTVASASHAHNFISSLIYNNGEQVCEQLGIEDGVDIAIIPVPSSDVVENNRGTVRWSGREIGKRLEAAGFGTLCPIVVNKRPITGKTDGGSNDYAKLVEVYEVIGELPDGAVPLYLDDMITWGTHIAAMDEVLEQPEGACAVAFCRTDKEHRNAFDVRTGEIVVSMFLGATSTTIT